MTAGSPNVRMVVATYRRPDSLERLLRSLATEGPTLGGTVVVNNSGDGDTARVAAEASPVPARVISPGANLGTGGGLAAGLAGAFEDPEVTHAWIMDDDACATPGALSALLAAGAAARAGAVSPLLSDEGGIVRWFPRPLAQPACHVSRSQVTPQQFRERCGDAPLRWNWATWVGLLVTRQAYAEAGPPRSDLWFQSTDIEYTLRLSARFACVLAPAAACLHLPPPCPAALARRKELWALQNNAFITFRTRHGLRILRHLPGNHYRYWRQNGRSPDALAESALALWRGAALGRPVGAASYAAFTAGQN